MSKDNKSTNNLTNPDLKISQDIKYNWHEDPYGYYSLAKEIDIPFHIFEIFSASLKDPNEEEYPSRPNTAYINTKLNAKLRLNIPIVETILLENGQIISWIHNDKDGFVAKKRLKKNGINNIIYYFLDKIKNFSIDGQKPFSKIDKNKIISDLQSHAPNIIHKKGDITERYFKQNHLEYIHNMEQIKFILLFYYSEKEPLLADYVTFYYILNEHGGLNSIKMIQNCMNCKFKNPSLFTSNSLKSSFNKENLSFLYNNTYNKNSESELRKIIVKYSKPSELGPKNFFVFYEKPQVSNLYNNNQTNNFYNTSTSRYKKAISENIFKKNIPNKKIFINADLKKSNELSEFDLDSKKRSSIINFNVNNKIEEKENQKSFEKSFKYYLRKNKNADKNFLLHVHKIEENLILQSSDFLIKTLSQLTENLIKYIEREKNLIVLNGYFNFVRISDLNSPTDDFYAFQKCLLLQGIDKNEPPVIEKTNVLKTNMKNIISKRIPEDVNKFKYFEKFTKDNFCHGEFCHYVVPSLFKGIKEPLNKKYNFKIPKENKISTRNKNNELPEKIPLFEIKKVYDNPDLANLVLKAYSIFPPSFNKEAIIESLIKNRNKKEENQKEKLKEINKNNNEEEIKKQPVKILEDEYDSIMNSYERISEKIQEYENEFKQEIIVYKPTPGKFLNSDFNNMYTDKGVCQKCYKIYTLILEFLSNIDECTAEFKSLIRAKRFLIKGENLQINNYDDKSGNENNLIIQEELGKTSIKKFLGLKILKLRREELKKYKPKEKFRIVRNIITQKKELNKIFNYNIKINLRLLLSNLLAEKTNNQFFNLLFDEILTDEDSILKHLDIKKPEFNFEKTNLKDLRFQMGISSLTYNPKIEDKEGNKKNFLLEKRIQHEKEMEENQIVKNIKQQICQVDKNLFQEYDLLNKSFKENENNKNLEEINKFRIKNKTQIMEEIFEYYRIPALSRVRYFSIGEKENKYLNDSNFILDEEENERYNTLQNKPVSVLLKMHKIKNLARIKQGRIKKETTRLFKFNQIKSLEEIKRQKEKQFERFLKFNTKKYRNKTKRIKGQPIGNKSIDEEISREIMSSSFEISIRDDEYKSKNKSNNDSEKWDKDKVILYSIFHNKKSPEFIDSNSNPYFYITTPFPKLRDFNSTTRINKNPLDILRKIDIEYIISLGNFKEKEINKGKNILSSLNVRFYSDDNFTSIPYEILDFNDTENFEQNKKRNVFKNAYNNIFTANQKGENKKKYIVFVLNDFFDTYVKYKNIFKNILHKLKGQYFEMDKDTINKNQNKKILNLKINEKDDLFLNIKSKNKQTNIHSNRRQNTQHTTVSNKMPNIYNNTNTDTNLKINNDKNAEIQSQIKKERISELKFVLFNLPGQSTTLFTKKSTQNNIYYTELLDRFIYFLYKEKEFDLSFKIILLGFGNGGQIALTYTSLYEKYWNILDSTILFNSYCKNGTIINEAMLDILKTATKEKNPKKVEAFIKQSIRNPKEFNIVEKKKKQRGLGDETLEIQKNMKNQYLNEKKRGSISGYKLSSEKIRHIYDNLENREKDENSDNEDIENNMTLDGYKSIAKGYFYNIPINFKDITTKILCVHSNVDSFVNIHNISPLFDNDIPSYRVTPMKKFFLSYNLKKSNFNKNLNKITSVMGYDLTDFRKSQDNKRKLIIFDGSHDITYSTNEDDNIVCTTLISYFK